MAKFYKAQERVKHGICESNSTILAVTDSSSVQSYNPGIICRSAAEARESYGQAVG